MSKNQWEVVQEAITKCNLPLFVKLVFDEVCRWRSYDKVTIIFTNSSDKYYYHNVCYTRIDRSSRKQSLPFYFYRISNIDGDNKSNVCT